MTWQERLKVVNAVDSGLTMAFDESDIGTSKEMR